MEAIAKSKMQRYGRRKVAQILDEIRGKSVAKAKQIISLTPRRCSVLVDKTVHSAAANLIVKAGKKLTPSQMWVTTAYADKGPMKPLRRFRPGPMGRAMPFKRKMCHLTVIVSDTKNRKEE
jgi:large subunit ribosomal protein L22